MEHHEIKDLILSKLKDAPMETIGLKEDVIFNDVEVESLTRRILMYGMIEDGYIKEGGPDTFLAPPYYTINLKGYRKLIEGGFTKDWEIENRNNEKERRYRAGVVLREGIIISLTAVSIIISLYNINSNETLIKQSVNTSMNAISMRVNFLIDSLVQSKMATKPTKEKEKNNKPPKSQR